MQEIFLPGIGAMLAAGHELVARGELDVLEPAGRGEFRFRFGRQFLAGPSGADALAYGCEDGFERTSPVMAFPPNGYGVYDMIGNV